MASLEVDLFFLGNHAMLSFLFSIRIEVFENFSMKRGNQGHDTDRLTAVRNAKIPVLNLCRAELKRTLFQRGSI
jgi:hypothetical protein